jgi:hypothetical protein
MTNPHVFFDISIGGAPAGRVVMELFADQVPKVLTFATPPSGFFRNLHRTKADKYTTDRRELPRSLHW